MNIVLSTDIGNSDPSVKSVVDSWRGIFENQVYPNNSFSGCKQILSIDFASLTRAAGLSFENQKLFLHGP